MAAVAVEAASDPAAAPPPLRVIVGSTNPVKIGAVLDAFTAAFGGGVTVEGREAASGVSVQPMGDAETLQGARNRAVHAAAATGGAAAVDYAVGLEGGCSDGPTPPGDAATTPDLECMAWIAVLHVGSGRWGTARTGTFALPPAVASLVRSGVELGEADDRVFGRTDSKRKDGAVGLLTRGLIDRRSYYAHAATLALIPFISADHY